MKVVYENDFLEDFQNANVNSGGDDDEAAGGDQTERPIQGNDGGEGNELQGSGQHAEIIYQQYQPSNVTELREYILFLVCKRLKKIFKKSLAPSPLGPGHVNHLSNKLIDYLQENQKQRKKLLSKYNNDILLFDSIFESGNLLQAEIVNPTEY